MANRDRSDKVYNEAVARGHYKHYSGGLTGKYDNVRIYWEDQIRGIMLRPHLQTLVHRKKRVGSKVRIADLGAGSGEGLRLLTSCTRQEADLRVHQDKVLPDEMIDVYIGCDLSEAMVAQGNATYADRSNVIFHQGDFSNGFPLSDEESFDLYFCSYGGFSHIDGQAMERLLTEVVGHATDRSVVVGEWLGRHAIEWPCYWGESGDKMLDYSMSWLSPGNEAKPECFPIRFWLGEEIRSLVRRVADKTNTRLRILELYDCSIFVGRHVDTGEYNDWINPVRSAVNRLHESNLRTDLESLRVDVVPTPGHDGLNSFFATLRFCWNNFLDYCQRRLEKQQHPVLTKHWRSFPPALQMAIMTIDRVIDNVSWMRMGDPRANIIEPQMGYALRKLELELQEGAGRGHALVGIFEVRNVARVCDHF